MVTDGAAAAAAAAAGELIVHVQLLLTEQSINLLLSWTLHPRLETMSQYSTKPER